MAENNFIKDESVNKNERIIDAWGRRNPRFEKKFEQSVIRVIADYGVGASEYTDAKGKKLGAGYEVLIIAFFIGLYSNKKFPLNEDSDSLKVLGQPIEKWGNLDSKKFRKAYSELRNYIFMALVAKTDIDWIALDKGDIKVNSVVTQLMETMEEYVNYGLIVMEEKLADDKSYFFSERAFLDIFMQLTEKRQTNAQDDIEEL